MTLANLLVAAETLFLLAMIAAFVVMWRRGTGAFAKGLGARWIAITPIALLFQLWMGMQVPLSAALPTLGIILAGGLVYLVARRSSADIEQIHVAAA